jgi:hypothetical protein
VSAGQPRRYGLEDFDPPAWFHASRGALESSADADGYLHVGTRAAALDRYRTTVEERGDSGGTLYELRIVDPGPVRSQLEALRAGADPWDCLDGDEVLHDYGLAEWGIAAERSASFYLNVCEDLGSVSLFAPLDIFEVLTTEPIVPGFAARQRQPDGRSAPIRGRSRGRGMPRSGDEVSGTGSVGQMSGG